MYVRTPKDIGAAIRDRRKKRGLDQAGLAALIGVSRKWIIDVEKGKPRAEISLILKTLNALDLDIIIDEGGSDQRRDDNDDVDIDAIVADARGKKR